MNKIIKYTAVILFTSLFIVCIGIIAFINFYNPNNFKPLIISQIKNYTHRDANITGDLSWTFFPNLGLKVGQISIDNIKIAQITVEAKLLPLLHGKLEMSGIDLVGVDYNEIKNAEFHGKNVTLQDDFPMSLQLDYQLNKSTVAKIKIDGRFYLDDVKQIFIWNDIKGMFANIPLTGVVEGKNLFSEPQISGHVSFKSFDLKQTLQALGQKIDAIQTAKNTKGFINFTATQKNVSAHGEFTMDTLQVNHMRLSQIVTHPSFQNGILDLSPITAVLYQGTLHSQANININNPQPMLGINASLKNILIASLLRDVSGKDAKFSMEGLGNVDFQVRSVGNDSQAMLSHLNGSGQFNINNGALIGIDLNTLIANAAALAKKQATTTSKSDKTMFDRLSGTATIHNGILQNNDLVISSARFETRGSGKIDFPSHWINFLFHTTIKKPNPSQSNDWDNLFGIPVPIAIRGNLSDPSVSLDAGQLLAAIAQEQAKSEVKTQVKEQIQKNLPGAAGDLLQQMIGR